jgi:pimeloyl-ACP methyl ester carboxylesterase
MTTGRTSTPTPGGKHGCAKGNRGSWWFWGKYDPSFDPSEPEACRRDVPKAEVHVLDAGHFAIDTKADEIAVLIGQFMKTQK